MLTSAGGIAIYLWTVPDSVSAPVKPAGPAAPRAKIDTISFAPPTVPRFGSPLLVEASSTQALSAKAPAVSAAAVSDGAARVRQLQTALARAGCYRGAVSGIWNDASKDAMRGFMAAVNAALPVENPDDAMVALVETNASAKCPAGGAISTASLPSMPLPDSTAETPALLTKTWAPAGMLVPTKAPAASPEPVVSDAAEAETGRAHDVLASNDQSATEPQPVPAPPALPLKPQTSASPAPLPSAAAQSPSTPKPAAADQTAPPPKKKRTKTARRRPGKDDNVETTISKGFDTLQRSLASMF